MTQRTNHPLENPHGTGCVTVGRQRFSPDSQTARDIPPEARTRLCDLREYEANAVLTHLVGDAQRILVVGDFGGRETFSLRALGKSVTALDIAPQSAIPDLILADITKPLPLPDNSFDCAVVGEVLEHIVEDHTALKEIRRVLNENGTLILSVPYFNDAPEFHVRIHSRATITRLLRYCGFTVDAYLERGGLITLMQWKAARLMHAVVARVVAICSRKTAWQAYFSLNRAAVHIDKFLASHAPILLRGSIYHGAYLKARKADSWDYRDLNVQEFQR